MAELNNPRYEEFARGLANGLSQRSAYRAAFPNAKHWKDKTVDNRACELYNTREVMGRVKTLCECATSKAVLSATQRKEWLTKVILSDEEETKDRLKAVDILNRMEGEYIEKVSVNGEINNPFAGLSTEELKKMIGDE